MLKELVCPCCGKSWAPAFAGVTVYWDLAKQT
jgi:hypothetical protein